MPVQDDFLVNFPNKTIYHSTTAVALKYSVNALYSYLMDYMDNQVNMEQPVPMSAQTPTEYTLINGYFMPYLTTHGLSGGAIQTNGLNQSVWQLKMNSSTGVGVSGGWLAPVEGDRFKTVQGYVRDGAVAGGIIDGATGVLLGWDGPEYKWWIRCTNNAFSANTGYALSIVTGTGSGATESASANSGEFMFTNVYTLGTLSGNTQLYILQGANTGTTANAGTISGWWGTGQIDLLIKVKESGVPLYGSNLTVYAREYLNTYDHFLINAPSGRNAVPISVADDGFNDTEGSALTASAASTITFTFSLVSQDINNGFGPAPYWCTIDCKSQTLATVYEWTKHRTRRQTTNYINAVSSVSGYTYIEASNTGAFAAVKTAPFGTYTGRFFAAQGVYFTGLAAADAKNYVLVDNNGVTQNPPNLVTVNITSLVAGDSVFVAETTALASGVIIKDKYWIALTGVPLSSQTLTVRANPVYGSYAGGAGALSGEVPKYGFVRVTSASATEQRYSFTAWSASTIYLGATGTPGSTSVEYFGVVPPDYLYIPFIDQAATAATQYTTIIQALNVPVVIRVRLKGIIPFEIAGTIDSTGLTQAAIRSTDTIVT